ncbi:neisseria meningitidis tspb protein [Inoviridae sp.]|nr:neisseria meningitidis tspb protein [Inoviridae sp.]
MRKLLYILWFLVFSLQAQAASVQAINWFNTQGTSIYNSNSSGVHFSTPEAACRNYYDRQSSTLGTLVSIYLGGGTATSNPYCYVRFAAFSNGSQQIINTSINIAYQCPAGYTLDINSGSIYSRQCTIANCPAGTTLNTTTNQCVDNCMQFKDQKVAFQTRGSANLPDGGLSVCMDNSCEAIVLSAEGACLSISGCYGNVDAKYSGKSCNSSSSPVGAFTNPNNQQPAPTNSPEADCIKQGKSFGTVNGQVVCVASGTPGSPAIKSTATSTTTTTNTGTNGTQTSSGSSQTQTVTQDGQIVKTETKTTNPDGTITTESKEQPFDKFCEQNPNNKLCKMESESKFSGSCAATFSCEGDAVQCAIALKQHQMYCEAIEDNPVRDDFTNEVAANAGKGLSDWIPQSIVNIPTDLTGQKLLPNACLADMVFPIVGHSITLPLSKLCPALEFCGTVVKLFSYLFSAIIIFGRRGS